MENKNQKDQDEMDEREQGACFVRNFELPDGMKFKSCAECHSLHGADRRCLRCNAPIFDDDSYCSKCGIPIEKMPEEADGYCIVARALRVALEKHWGQLRKGTQVTYFVHIMDVLGNLLRESEGSLPEHVLAAGILHDVLEDTDYGAEALGRDFGPKVLELVRGASEKDNLPGISREQKQASWKRRKDHTIDLVRSTDNPELLRVILADKLANIGDIDADRVAGGIGPAYWARFNASGDEIARHYRKLVEAFREVGMAESRMFRLFEAKVASVFGEAGPAQAKASET
jgi:hypothetical protein